VILVIDHGRIIERGSHQELIAKNGAYARLHSMQIKANSKKGKGLVSPYPLLGSNEASTSDFGQ
jgi:hypothetical protein